MLFRFLQLEDKFFTNILNSISYIQCSVPWKVFIYTLISYTGAMPPPNVVLFVRCSFISSTSLPHSDNDHDCKEVRKNLMRLFYCQEMNLQKLCDLVSVFSYH
jgi:hypothetical protein